MIDVVQRLSGNELADTYVDTLRTLSRCYFLNSMSGRAWIAEVVNRQAGQANVNGTKLQELTYPLPPL
jgi:type I restriction enzyme, S subunit